MIPQTLSQRSIQCPDTPQCTDTPSRNASKLFPTIFSKSKETHSLQRMLKTGWLESEMGLSARSRPARIFKVTEAGRQHRQEERSSFEKMFAGITRVLAVAQS